MADDAVTTADTNPDTPASDALAAAPAAAAPAPAAPPQPAAAAPAAPAAAPAAPAASAPAAAPEPKPAEPPKEVSWRDGIVDPTLKNVADRLASPTDAVKAIVDLRTELSKRVKVPDDGASEEDKTKFRKALGVPDSVDGYEITLPDGIEMTEADQQVLSAVLPMAYEAGVPKKAMSDFVGKFMEMSRQAEDATVQQIEQFGQETERMLKREWGQEFDRNLNLANRVGEIVGGPEFKAFLNETPIIGGGMLGDHPAMVKFLATVGRRTDEGDLMLGATPEERGNIQGQIDEIMAKHPPGTDGYKSKAVQTELQGLFDQLYGREPIVGSQGRMA